MSWVLNVLHVKESGIGLLLLTLNCSSKYKNSEVLQHSNYHDAFLVE